MKAGSIVKPVCAGHRAGLSARTILLNAAEISQALYGWDC